MNVLTVEHSKKLTIKWNFFLVIYIRSRQHAWKAYLASKLQWVNGFEPPPPHPREVSTCS
jgi:hypothetical protein